jgi:hypothetical protein
LPNSRRWGISSAVNPNANPGGQQAFTGVCRFVVMAVSCSEGRPCVVHVFFFGAARIVVVHRLLCIHTVAMEVHAVLDGTVCPVYHHLNCPRQTVVAWLLLA